MKPGLYDNDNNLIKTWEELEELSAFKKLKPEDQKNGNATKIKELTSTLSGVLVVPEKIDFKTMQLFNGWISIEKIILPDSINSFEEGEFGFCCSLKEINIPKNIKKIPMYTFNKCKSLEKIKFPKSMDKIDTHAFLNCTSLKEVTLPENANVRHSSFQGCSSLKTVTIPDTTKVHPDTFNNCTALEEIRASKKWLLENPEFEKKYKDVIVSSIDDLINKNKSFKEINKIFKDKDIER